ncbi:MAG: protein kinase domain-containing protein [Desulfatibacillaceae bacterium]
MELVLKVVKGPESGRRFIIDKPGAWLGGRAPEARVRFSEKDPYISRRHFLLEMAPPNAYFSDLDVSNPSHVNETRAQPCLLKHGDVIEVGYTRLEVAISLAATDLERADTDGKPESGGEFPGPQPASSTVAPDASCHKCDTDLSMVANSDGKAKEVAGAVRHLCETCADKAASGGGGEIGPYRILRTVGRGGMGTAYLAVHQASRRLVVVKDVAPGPGASLAAGRFERECSVMARIRHKNVVRYVESGKDPASGRAYLALEYAPMGSLRDMLAKKGVLPPRTAATLARAVLYGVEAVHAHGILHRDIKPANILFGKSDTGSLVPKLADFGLARHYASAGGPVLTRMGMGGGSALYVPPEQITDLHGVDQTADVYSLGATLYHVLSGRHVYDFPRAGEPDRERARKNPFLVVLDEEPVPLARRMPCLPEGLSSVVDKATSRDPGDRYLSAREFRLALSRVLDSL